MKTPAFAGAVSCCSHWNSVELGGNILDGLVDQRFAFAAHLLAEHDAGRFDGDVGGAGADIGDGLCLGLRDLVFHRLGAAGNQRIERSASYTKYKEAADALFSGGVLPQGLEQKFDPDGKRKAQKEAMMKLREVPDRKAWVQGVVDYLQLYPELPEDAYFLDSLLDHPKERIVDKALAQLEQLHEEGKLAGKTPKSLEQRLKSIELTSLDPDMQARAKVLREKVRA